MVLARAERLPGEVQGRAEVAAVVPGTRRYRVAGRPSSRTRWVSESLLPWSFSLT